MARLRTLSVNRGGVPVLINETDYSPDRDKLWSGGAPEREAPAPDKAKVINEGRGWYSVKAGGKELTEAKVRKEKAEQIADEYNEEL